MVLAADQASSSLSLFRNFDINNWSSPEGCLQLADSNRQCPC